MMKESINCQEEKPSTAYSAFLTFLFAFCLRLLKRLNLWPTALLPQLYRFSLADELFCVFILPGANQRKCQHRSIHIYFVKGLPAGKTWEYQFSTHSAKSIWLKLFYTSNIPLLPTFPTFNTVNPFCLGFMNLRLGKGTCKKKDLQINPYH